jgi:hypothetical protein
MTNPWSMVIQDEVCAAFLCQYSHLSLAGEILKLVSAVSLDRSDHDCNQQAFNNQHEKSTLHVSTAYIPLMLPTLYPSSSSNEPFGASNQVNPCIFSFMPCKGTQEKAVSNVLC